MNTKPYKIGYTAGVFDLFHIGHLNLLRRAKEQCEHLIVAVSTDELVAYKGKKPVIPFAERLEIVQAIRYVDEAVPQYDIDKYKAWEKYHYNAIFVGDDWKGTPRWNDFEARLRPHRVDVVYFPYTQSTSSTLVTQCLIKLQETQ